MKVVVIGGGGHIGSFLIPKLVKAQHDVVVITRGKSQPYYQDWTWQKVEHVILDRQKNSFKFENDYKNKTLKNVSDYEEAYNRENRNFNFYNVL